MLMPEKGTVTLEHIHSVLADYQETLHHLIRIKVVNAKIRVLVVCGGDPDKEV